MSNIFLKANLCKTTFVLVLLWRESICTDTDSDTACLTGSGRQTEMCYVLGCIYRYRGLYTSLPFPLRHHGTSSVETIVGRMLEGRRNAVLSHQNFGRRQRHFFSDQCCELLCFALRDLADLRHGWITRVFPPARKNSEKRHKK